MGIALIDARGGFALSALSLEPAKEAMGLFPQDPIARPPGQTGWLLWAILAAMVVVWLADDLVRAWRRRRRAERERRSEGSSVLSESRTALRRRQPRRSPPARRAPAESRGPGRLTASGSVSKPPTSERRAGRR
jgi:hypothetical protein